MLTKFETKSARVKGLSFHPKRPWVLASLHNGSVQIWDYRMGTLVDTFSEHEGPVRACAFHPMQPLFVTCGDDSKIRVFNYQQRKCLFVLSGHQDYIRSVCFHHESPWIMTASDDQTIKIWNWQSRACVAQLTGHSHYVMCAHFHPKEDLVISASLDQSIRVWDIGYLRRKGSVTPVGDDTSSPRPGQIELFANSEGQVKFILEGHDRGVNWVQFHPTKPLIVSGSDDRSVKLWRYNDNRAWETDTFRGHFNNVSCVMFHPTQDLIISNSEDKTIRIWDYSKRGAQAQVFRRDSDRYWTLASHPSLPLFAGGHDSGMLLFKLERERPPMVIVDDNVFYTKGANILRRDLNKLSASESSVGALSHPPNLPANFDYSSTEKAFLISSGSEYEILGRATKQGHGSHAFFISRQRFVVFDVLPQQIHVKAVNDNSLKASIPCPIPTVEHIFTAPNDCVLFVSQSAVCLYDLNKELVLAELPISKVKRVSWSPDYSRCALMSKKGISIVDFAFSLISTCTEMVAIKSGVWDSAGLFYFTTPHHLKYLLPTGETGLICTIENTLYLVRVKGDLVQALDRQVNLVNLRIDPAEFVFKLALIQHDLPKVLHIINTSNLVGQSVISYLRQHGYSAIALQFVDDSMARFELALECGNFDVAQESAEALEKEEVWKHLAQHAMKLGNVAVAKLATQKAGQLSQSAFFSAISGDHEGLRGCLKEAAVNGDLTSRLQSAMLLNDSLDLAKSLEEMGLHSLAYLAYRNAGVDGGQIPSNVTPNLPSSTEKLYPVSPLATFAPVTNWPLTKQLYDITVPSGMTKKFEKQQQHSPSYNSSQQSQQQQFAVAASTTIVPGATLDDEDGGWECGDDLKIDAAQHASGEAGEFQDFSMAEPNPLLQSNVPTLHLLAGSVNSAKKLMREQAGIIDFEPLDPLFKEASQLQTFGSLLNRFEDATPVITFADIEQKFDAGLGATTSGKFSDAIRFFESAIHSCLFTILQPGENVEDLIAEAREYITGLRMELKRKELLATTGGVEPSGDLAVRVLELACYFTTCRLRPEHIALALRSAMTLSFKLKEYALSGRLASRLLGLAPGEPISSQAQKVLAAAEKIAATATNSEGLQLDFDDHVSFSMDAATFKPIYSGMPCVTCPFCHAVYNPSETGSACSVCRVAGVGEEASGLSLSM